MSRPAFPAVLPPTVPSPSRRTARLGVGLLTVGLLALGAGPAAAHNALVGTDPADGSTVATAPDAVTLTFNEPAVALGTQIQVTGPDGTELAVGEPQLVDRSVVQELAAERPAGEYRVVWRVTSADGHPIDGELGFQATDAVGAPDDAATPPVEEPTTEPTDAADPTGEPDADSPGATDAPGTPADDAAQDDADQPAADSDQSDDGGSLPGWVIPVAVLALAAIVGTLIARRRRT